MKKILCIVMLVAVLVSALIVPASAATPAQEVSSAIKAAIPASYNDLFVASVDNILNQIDVTEDQADQVIAIINETTAKIKDKGSSLHNYTDDEVQFLISQFSKACGILNVTYKFVLKSNATHTNDIVCKLYYNGKHIGTLDGDAAVNQTGVDAQSSSAIFAVSAGLLMVCAAAFIFKKSASKVN